MRRTARSMGNRSIFSPKNGDRFQGMTTKVGSAKFEEARARLGALAGRKAHAVSDGDVFEYLSRGIADTVAYLVTKDRVK